MEHFPVSSAFLCLIEPEIWKFKTSRCEIFIPHDTSVASIILQFARKNWISTSASINAQLRYSLGTTLFHVNLPCLRMLLVKLEDVSLGPEPCTLLFLNLLRDEAWTHWTWDQPLESFVASSGSIKLLMSCQFLLHSRHVWPENLFSTTNKTSVPLYKS